MDYMFCTSLCKLSFIVIIRKHWLHDKYVVMNLNLWYDMFGKWSAVTFSEQNL